MTKNVTLSKKYNHVRPGDADSVMNPWNMRGSTSEEKIEFDRETTL